MHITILAAEIPRVLPEAAEEKLRAFMPAPRLERLALESPASRAQALCAWALLGRAVDAAGAGIAYSQTGKPYFSPPNGKFFSLSHTQGAALCAVADAEVGADVERLRPVDEAVARRMGAAGAEDFIARWVRRESRAKYLGTGAFAAPMRFSDGEEAGKYYSLELLPGFVSGVFCGGDAVISARTLDINWLSA